MSKVDYLIVGQGIAGSILAYQLLKKGKTILVVDKGLEFASSMVAAGITNPLVLKRLTFSWRAKEFTKYNQSFYHELNSFLGSPFINNIDLLKVIKSEDELLFWKNKVKEEGLKSNISMPYVSESKQKIKDCYFGPVHFASWLNLKPFLKSFRAYLKTNKMLLEEEFEYSKIELRSYKNTSFNKVVFCEGRNAKQNPFFDFVGFAPTKGELLTIKSKELKSEAILKKGVFILPIGNETYKVGATYEWKWENENPTESKKNIIVEKLEEIIDCPYEIVSHESGVRPSVIDRRPIMGANPFISNYFMFNGLGSRGCLMVPLLAEELINNIELGNNIDKEADLRRFLVKQD